ncbi:MAG TPA: TonB-dependent receptor [Vicinamibacterales bacterium]|nr:TonB-dependent receptor [Vicinamibacterales bacterium]
MPLPTRVVRLLWVVLVVVTSTAAAAGQPATERQITGTVRHGESRVPLTGAAIAAGERRTSSDREGRFTLRVAAGVAVLDVTHPGFYPLTTTIDVSETDALDAELLLVPRSAFAASVDVVAAPPPAAAPSAVVLAPVEVLRTPGALDNVFRTLQTLPGVSATEEFGSRLAVRGGAPDQNLTMMDGVEIHDPYRLFGLTSAFNPETISNFELATGGFSVKYGDRLSSLLLVENREGTRQQRLDGSVALSITDANVVLEGALPRAASGSWLVSARRTYYDLVASRVADQEFPQFADVQGKAVWEPAPGTRVSAFALRSRQHAALDLDSSDVRGEFNDTTSNDLVSLRFDALLRSSVQSHTIAAHSRSLSSFGVNAAFDNNSQRANTPAPDAGDVANVDFDRTLGVRDTSLREELSWAAGAHVVETGGELHALSTELAFVLRGDRNPTAVNGSSQQGGAGLPDALLSSRHLIRGGAWLSDRWQAAAVAVEGGVRLDRGGVDNELLFSPRITTTWSIAPLTRLRAGLGRYTQSPGYEKLVQGDYLLDLTGADARRLRSEQAVQASMGFERDLAGSALLKLEAYFKHSSRLLVGRLETEAERLARLATYDFPPALASSIPSEPIITSSPSNDGRGRAYGFDLFITRTSAPATARLRGWASYTWGSARRESYGRHYAFEYDRRHAFSSVLSFRLSERWEVASTTRVASGFPRVAPIGLRVASVQDTTDRDRDGSVDERVPAFDAMGNPIYAVNFGGVEHLNNARLPVFARLDLRATWRPRGARGRWEFYAEVVNALGRENAGALDPQLEYDPTADRPRIVEKRDQGIPRLPTFGLRVRF